MRRSKFKIVLLTLLCTLLSAATWAVNYYSIADGPYNYVGSWSIGIPPSTLPLGDTVFVYHEIALSADIFIQGVLMVEPSGQLTGSKKIKIDFGAYVLNNGSIDIAKEIHVDGFLYNTETMNIEKLHSDGYICNSGLIELVPGQRFDHHGGTVECCGTILADVVKFHENANVSGTEAITNCQNYCNTSLTGPPVLDMGGTVATPTEAVNNDFPDDSYMDTDNVTFCGLTVLPIELISFDVQPLNSHAAMIFWSTASEANNDHFTVLRSYNAQEWEVAGVVSAAGNSNEIVSYELMDIGLNTDLIYYRLQQTDFDGNSEYYDIKAVTFSKGNTVVEVYPNPTTSVVHLVVDKSTKIEDVAMVDALGANVISRVQVVWISEGRFAIDMSQLISGIYLIKIKDEAHRIIKE